MLDRSRASMTRAPVAFVRGWLTERWHGLEVAQPRPTPEATREALVVIATMCFVVTLMQYTILSATFPDAVMDEVPRLLGRFGGERAAAWGTHYQGLWRNLAWALGVIFFYLVVPATVVTNLLGRPLSDYGLRVADFRRHLPAYLLLFLPVAVGVVFASGTAEFQRAYPFYKTARGVADVTVWEVAYAAQFFSVELFFRGFVLFGLWRAIGPYAILAAVVPYTMVHFHKPLLETLGASLAGGVLGLLALSTGSIWGGVLLHVAIAWLMDALAYARG